MNINAQRKFADTWFEQVWNLGDASAIDRMVAPAAVCHGVAAPGDPPVVGPDPFKAFVGEMRTAIPDIRIQVLRTVCEDDTVVSYCRVTGTHTGAGPGGARPTANPIDIHGFGMVVLQDGVIQESWNCFDYLTLYRQLGLLPAAAAPA